MQAFVFPCKRWHAHGLLFSGWLGIKVYTLQTSLIAQLECCQISETENIETSIHRHMFKDEERCLFHFCSNGRATAMLQCCKYSAKFFFALQYFFVLFLKSHGSSEMIGKKECSSKVCFAYANL